MASHPTCKGQKLPNIHFWETLPNLESTGSNEVLLLVAAVVSRHCYICQVTSHFSIRLI